MIVALVVVILLLIIISKYTHTHTHMNFVPCKLSVQSICFYTEASEYLTSGFLSLEFTSLFFVFVFFSSCDLAVSLVSGREVRGIMYSSSFLSLIFLLSFLRTRGGAAQGWAAHCICLFWQGLETKQTGAEFILYVYDNTTYQALTSKAQHRCRPISCMRTNTMVILLYMHSVRLKTN